MATTFKITVEDYRDLPEAGPRYQLIDGDLYMLPAPNRWHQLYSRNLQFILTRYLNENPLGELYNAPFDVILSEVDVYQPDLVVEILSPRTSKIDRTIKRQQFARFGVKELWFIEPETRRILVYDFKVRTDHPVALREDDAEFECQFFPGLKLLASKIFADRIGDL